MVLKNKNHRVRFSRVLPSSDKLVQMETVIYCHDNGASPVTPQLGGSNK